jgi:hypothetical protein
MKAILPSSLCDFNSALLAPSKASTRRDRINADSMGREVSGERLRKHLLGTLRRRVDESASDADERSDRRHVDDVAACLTQ